MRRLTIPAALLLLCLAAPALAQVPPPGLPSFKELDANGDGRVSMAEVMAHALKKSSLAQPFRVEDVDADHDGVITPEELARAGIKGFEGMGPIDVKELDIRGDGYVSREDLDEYFRRKHREAFVRADADRSGHLSPDELVLFRF